MISYPQKAINALIYLFKPYNDIEVFVEDTVCRNLYEVLITRMLPPGTNVKKIFQLGGRKKVIDACRENQNNSNKNSLFIIDGDLDLIIKRRSPKLKNFYRLSVYCSENLVVSKKAIIEIGMETLSNSDKTQIESLLQYEKFINDTGEKLKDLFVYYAIAHKLQSGFETTNYNVGQLCINTPSGPSLSNTRIQQRLNAIKNKLIMLHGQLKINQLFKKISKSIPKENDRRVLLYSGKTYMLPLIYHHMKRKINYKGNLDELKVRLARHCELNIDRGLYKLLRRTSRN